MASHREMCKGDILIVDDNIANLKTLEALLDHEGYRVRCAPNGRTALMLVDSLPPDLILLDVRMPEMDGYEVCAKIKADKNSSNIPIIFITAIREAEDEYRGFQLGAVDYIIKPFNPYLVNARVRTHLKLKQHQDHLDDLVRDRTLSLLQTQDATIFGLATLAEYRDPETGRHIKRTQSYVRLLAEHLKCNPRFSGVLDAQTIPLLCKSASLHDIGKVGVPDHILLKPGPLSHKEFDVMKMHTVYGRETLTKIRFDAAETGSCFFLRFAEEIAYYHHEKWDGSGYHCLKEEQIPVSARLMALADVYDALISTRVYKQAFSHEKAVEIICRGDGRTEPEHFDPDILQAFVDLESRFKQIAHDLADTEASGSFSAFFPSI